MRRYSVIYADPPWRYRDQHRGHGGAADHYQTASLDELKRLEVPAAENAALFLWATMPLLPQAVGLVESWGFRYTTTAFCWVKLNPKSPGLATGLGAWTRSNAELCLLGIRGHPRRMSRRVHSVVIAPRARHSEKPAEVRRRIVELFGDVSRLELFARSHAPGWDVWGDEVASSISLVWRGRERAA
jgi:N6-adenosine-specific RNA methylase IME4